MSNAAWSLLNMKSLIDSGEAETKTGPFGTQLKASDYVEHGTPVINVRNIGFGIIKPDKLEYLGDETVQRLSSHLLRVNDIVFGRKGAVERHVLIRPEQNKWFQGSDCLRLRITSNRVDARFVSYFLLTDDHKQWMMNQCSHGATMASLNQDIIWRISLHVPDIAIQRKIVSVLSAYDDLIENNSRRIVTLEAMAQAIYREWFVEFRFPGHEKAKLADSPQGRLPDGWRFLTLSHVAEVNALSIRKGEEPPEVNYVDIASVSTGKIDEIRLLPFSEAPGRARRIIRNGDIIWSTVRPNRRSYSLVLNPPQDMIASTGFAVISGTKAPFTYLYHALTTDDFVGYLVNHATGSAYPAVNSGDFESASILVPPDELLATFHDTTADLFLLKHTLEEKNRRLRQTRDLLLPKLILGNVDVADLEIDNGDSATISVEQREEPILATCPPKQLVVKQVKRTPYKDDAAVLCVVVDELFRASRPTTEFFVQKHTFALKHRRQLPVNSKFGALAAGPWSQELKRKAIFAAQQMGWLQFDEATKTVKAGLNLAKGLEHAKQVLKERYAEVKVVVDDFSKFGSTGLGKWMTVFKVVCDLKESGVAVTRASIQKGIDNWPNKRSKPDFSVENVDHTITGMVKHGWFSLG